MEKKEFTITADLFASQGQRFMNFIIDLFVQYIIGLCIGFTVAIFADVSNNTSLSERLGNMGKVEDYLFGLVITVSYYIVMEVYFSRTIAKYFTKTIVVMENGSKPDARTILIRTLCRLIPFDALTYLGGSSRGWHDTISKTYVVQKHKFLEAKTLFESFDEIGKE